MKKLHFISVVLVLAFILAACGFAPDQSSAEDVTLKVAWNVWPGDYPVAIAQAQGFFAKHNVAVDVIYYPSYPEAIVDYATGKVDALNITVGDLMPLLEKRPSKLVFMADSSEGADALIVADNILSPADLRGKRIGVNQGTYGEYWVREILKKNNLSISEVQMVQLPAESVSEDFLKTVDAAHSYEPYTSEALTRGGHVLLNSSDTTRFQLPSVYVFGANLAAEHPEALRGFVAAYFEAVDWMKAHPDEAPGVIASAVGLTPEDIWFGGDYVLTLADNKMLMQPGNDFNSVYFTANEYVKFLAEAGRLNTAPNVDTLIDSSFLP